MSNLNKNNKIISFDDRRNIIIPGDSETTLKYAIDHFIEIANLSIKDHGCFTVALSGGSTPKSIYHGLASPENAPKINWKKVFLFWSDERCVPKTDSESNYRMAMGAGFSQLPIPKENIFPMPTEGDLKEDAKQYEKLILKNVQSGSFDLMMLGMGEDGHTASLFPNTQALNLETAVQGNKVMQSFNSVGCLVVANHVLQKDTWRMTMTFDCINSSRNIAIYVLGKNKSEMVKRVLTSPYMPELLPIQKVGTPSHKALWVLDDDAAKDTLLT